MSIVDPWSGAPQPRRVLVQPLIGVLGKKYSGKDTLAGFLMEWHGFKRVAFADRMKATALDVNPYFPSPLSGRLRDLVDAWGWDQAKKHPEVRAFLQDFGQAVRAVDRDVWVWPVRWTVQGLLANGTPVVVTDVRLPNEVGMVRSLGGVLVRVLRDTGVEDGTEDHVSETALDDMPVDVVVDNNGSLGELREAAHELAEVVLP